jgi:DNA-binding response OmpR family regulator
MGLTEPREADARGRSEEVSQPLAFAAPASKTAQDTAVAGTVIPVTGDGSRRDEILRIANLEVRPAEFQLLADGRRVGLTVREFQTFLVLAERPDRVVTRPEIYALVWGGQMAYRDRSVDVFVRKVRRKLDAAAPGWVYVHTHFGVGYRFSPERVTAR